MHGVLQLRGHGGLKYQRPLKDPSILHHQNFKGFRILEQLAQNELSGWTC